MTRPVLPVDPRELAEMVARLWPEAARDHAVDPERIIVKAMPADGLLVVNWPFNGREPVMLARESLACALEDAGLEVDRDGYGRRVLGWAAWQTWTRLASPRLMPVRELPPSHAARREREDRLAAERAARREEPAT